jgi:hypothetical protein
MTTPTPESIREEIEALDGVVSVRLNDDIFFYDPDRVGDSARKVPMATLVSSNAYDQHSDLDREGVFRLNLGVDRNTFLDLFGMKASGLAPDYTALDVIMPHPDYGNSYFLCVLNPDRTMPKVRQLLTKAREVAANRYRSR